MEIKIMISRRSVIGAVQQSPYPFPENLEVVLGKMHDLISEDVDNTFKKHLKEFESKKECHDYIAKKLHSIPEFEEWNNRKNGREGHGFTGVGHNDKGDVVTVSKDPDPDDDFIDLDALTRNVANSAILEPLT